MEKEIDNSLHLVRKDFLCSHRRCSCLVRFACARLNGLLELDRLSKFCAMSGTEELIGPPFQALRDADDALSVRWMETVRSMARIVQRSLFFTLEELRHE